MHRLPEHPSTESDAPVPALPRPPLLPERADYLDGDSPAADKVAAFLGRALEASGSDAPDRRRSRSVDL